MRKTSFLDNLAINKEWGKMKNHHKKSSKMFKYLYPVFDYIFEDKPFRLMLQRYIL